MESQSTNLLGKSAINNETAKGSCRFKVLSSPILTGDLIYFPAFALGEHLWRVLCRPDKSFCLYYAGEYNDVNITFDFGLLKKDEASPSTKWRTIEHTFSMCGEFLVLQGNELKRYLEDDYFIIICNITILSAYMRNIDSNVSVLVALTGSSKSMPSIENKEISSTKPTKKEMASGSFQFKVTSSHLTANIDKFLDFPIFKIGEHYWLIRCCYQKGGYLSFYLYVQSETKDLKASLEFGSTRKDDGPSSVRWKTLTHTFKTCGEYVSLTKFIEGSELKKYLKRDNFRVICNVTILSTACTETSNYDVAVLTGSSSDVPKSRVVNLPSPCLTDQLGKLFQNNERADVTFEVNGEAFHAHRLILATRSPVFNTELFGPTNENNSESIKIDEIKPSVFKAMLHFIYTDVLPECVNDDMAPVEMTQQILIAADRYALDKLKLICEDILCDKITINNVAAILVLAAKHNCISLKARCLEIATLPQNFTKVAITDGYRHLLLSCPTILRELEEKLNGTSI